MFITSQSYSRQAAVRTRVGWARSVVSELGPDEQERAEQERGVRNLEHSRSHGPDPDRHKIHNPAVCDPIDLIRRATGNKQRNT